MKHIFPFLIGLSLAASVATLAQSPARQFSVIETGPHHQVAVASDGTPGARVHRLVELAAGMHYWNGQTWAPSEPVFEPTDEGFIASRVQHRLRLAGNLNVRGAVTIQTPGGVHLSSTPLAIALYDIASGNLVLATIS